MILMYPPRIDFPHRQGMPLGYAPQGTPGAYPQGQPKGLPVQGALMGAAQIPVTAAEERYGIPGLIGLPPQGASPNNQFHPQPHVGGNF
jgi:hypothetical protein